MDVHNGLSELYHNFRSVVQQQRRNDELTPQLTTVMDIATEEANEMLRTCSITDQPSPSNKAISSDEMIMRSDKPNRCEDSQEEVDIVYQFQQNMQYRNEVNDNDNVTIEVNGQQNEMETERLQQQEYSFDYVILGPNGTKINMKSFSSITWTSAPAVTRQLLRFVFSTDILGTHILGGKLPTAFVGRGHPPQKKLDPLKVADIIHFVLSKFNSNERIIRKIISIKCADAAKTYRRQKQKQKLAKTYYGSM